jgi:Tti2 family
MKPEDYEDVWHLVIPPTMIFLDDYESYYKLKGLIVVSELLEHVPPESLKRTGVDGLLVSVRQLSIHLSVFFTETPKSLKTTMTHLHSPLSPEILRRSIPLLVRVIDLTTPFDSKSRFDQLCTLLGDGILGGVWIYASTELDTVEASMIALPDVLQELGIGCVRYLKVKLPPCCCSFSCPILISFRHWSHN